jgi:hypothetical protein
VKLREYGTRVAALEPKAGWRSTTTPRARACV